MKKIVVILIVLSSSYFVNEAQTKTQFYGGLNHATIKTSPRVEVGSIIGYHVGINRESNLLNHVSIERGILFSTKGADYEWYEMDKERDGKMKLYSFNIPVIVKAICNIAKTDVFIGAGSYVGLSRGDMSTITTLVNQFDMYPDGRSTNPLSCTCKHLYPELGLMLKTGVVINNIMFNFTIDDGLTTYDGEEVGGEYQNYAYMFSVGYVFGE